jgi:hypothetical protein
MTSAGSLPLIKVAIANATKGRKLKMDSDYTQGFKAGKDRARKEIIDLIELHINSSVNLSDQEIVWEIEHLQKTDKDNGV